VRNYDYHPHHCEGAIVFSQWHGTKVIAQSDTLWGVLDGMNEHGLAVSLAFGGRRVVGDGFGAPLVLRYILEFCATAGEALKALRRIPSHMAYNIHVLDRSGKSLNVHVSPDREACVVDSLVATNHQREIEWTRHAEETRTLEREKFLLEQLDGGASAARFISSFLNPPLYSTRFDEGFGTLYTAAYDTKRLSATFLWPNHRWTLSFDNFDEAEVLIRY
jgi:predicted choloylglycine hydrolase